MHEGLSFFIYRLFNDFDPAFGCLEASHLDTGQGLIQFLGDRSHLIHTAGHADLFAVVYDLAYRGDDSCGAAQSALSEIFDFLKVNRSLFNLKSQIFTCYVNQRTTGDRRQDAVRFRSDYLAVFGNEQEVGSAGLLYLGSVAASRYIFSS